MKGPGDDDLKLAFSGSYAARGMGVVALPVARDSVGGAGHSRDGALPQGFGPLRGGSWRPADHAGGASRDFLLLSERGRRPDVDSLGADSGAPEGRAMETFSTVCTSH